MQKTSLKTVLQGPAHPYLGKYSVQNLAASPLPWGVAALASSSQIKDKLVAGENGIRRVARPEHAASRIERKDG